jgi:predicted regulator of Ras-like GTPase activity (Roadblock/LC7/MglB family)
MTATLLTTSPFPDDMVGSTTWALTPEDEAALRRGIDRLLHESGSRCALLVDRGGQLLLSVGERPDFDATTFATLAAADYGANDQLARLLGEPDFATLFHQGERESLLLADVAGRAILVVIFDTRTTPGLVRLRLRPTVDELSRIVEAMTARDTGSGLPRPALLADADDEIDRLFQ